MARARIQGREVTSCSTRRRASPAQDPKQTRRTWSRSGQRGWTYTECRSPPRRASVSRTEPATAEHVPETAVPRLEDEPRAQIRHPLHAILELVRQFHRSTEESPRTPGRWLRRAQTNRRGNSRGAVRLRHAIRHCCSPQRLSQASPHTGPYVVAEAAPPNRPSTRTPGKPTTHRRVRTRIGRRSSSRSDRALR